MAMALSGCAADPSSLVAEPATTIDVGQWVTGQGMPVEEAEVLSRLHEADIVLMGEVHDSASIHRKQVELLRELDRPLVLGLEQLDLRTQNETDFNREAMPIDARERAERLGFDFDGWGWQHYRGLFELATSRHWPLWPLNLSRRSAFAVAMADEREGQWREALEVEQVEAIEALGGQPALPEALQSELVIDLQQAHCGRVDAAMARRMARAQVARDMLMADALVRARARYPAYPVIGVMGNQHARRDRGVGYWLDRPAMKGAGEVLAIGMLPIDSIETLSMSVAAYDFVWITEPVERDVDCDTAA